MAKKTRTKPVTKPPLEHPVKDVQLRAALEANRAMLDEIQSRVLNAPALNGGFDTLLYKVDKIEESQDRLVEKVDSIHEAVFHPDDGLFARVKAAEVKKAEGVDVLEKEVLQLKIWKESEVKQDEKDMKTTDEHVKQVEALQDKVKDQEAQIKTLVEWKTKVGAIVKWCLVTAAGGGVTLVGKLLYDFLSGHITFHG